MVVIFDNLVSIWQVAFKQGNSSDIMIIKYI